jgi:hypothetical protein
MLQFYGKTCILPMQYCDLTSSISCGAKAPSVCIVC